MTPTPKFRETTEHTTDDKARLVLPTRFREVVRASGHQALMISRLDRHLVAYPLPEWQVVEERIIQQAQKDEEMRRLRRHFVGGVAEVPMDRQGRILIPQSLRKYGGIEPKGEVVLVGVVDHFEIWERGLFEKDSERYEDDMSSGRMGDNIAKLGL